MKLAIFISGRGSNMVALLDYVCQQDVPVTAVLVLADGEATGLATAAERGSPPSRSGAVISAVNRHMKPRSLMPLRRAVPK